MSATALAAALAGLAVALAATPPAGGRPPRTVRTAPATARRRARWAVAAVAGVTLVATVALVVVLAVTAAAITWSATRRWRRAVRFATAQRAAVPEAIELLVVTVHAGLTPHQAVRRLATTGPLATQPAFAAVVHELERGRRLGDAVFRLTDHLGPALHPVVDAVATADRLGTPLAGVLERLAAEASAARRRAAEADARRLPVRLSGPLVACTLPAFVLLTIAPALLAALSSLRLHSP